MQTTRKTIYCKKGWSILKSEISVENISEIEIGSMEVGQAFINESTGLCVKVHNFNDSSGCKFYCFKDGCTYSAKKNIEFLIAEIDHDKSLIVYNIPVKPEK